MVTAKTSPTKRDLLLLLVWLIIGLILRFNNLADKPASSIEIATLGFSLGHGFNQIPLNELIPIDTLLSPLRVDNAIDSTDVIDRLFAESTHPPLYFCLTHWWIKLFVGNGELVSLQVGRSLSAILGGLAIPAMFGFGWLAWRNSLAAHFAAILMAVSPYGIYLAQEARHYTLSILWIIASLSCMVVAIDRLSRRQRIPWWLVLVWIVVNALGMATHYFFCLALALEGFVVVGFWLEQNRARSNRLSLNYWLPIVVVGLGSLAGCLVWLPVASGISGNELTDWIDTSYDSDEVWLPLPRILAWLITMVAMLPVEGTSLGVTIASGVIILMGMIWTMPQLMITWRSLLAKPNLITPKLFTCFMVGAAILYLCLIYGYGKDVSLAARYHFVYFPVVLVILAAILARLWQRLGTKIIVIAIVTIGLLGSFTVTEDLGFRKSRRANNMAQQIQQVSQNRTIVATTYDSHSQLREAIALALALENNNSTKESNLPKFLILERNENSKNRLQEIVASQPKPLNLWGINLKIYNGYLSRIGCGERRQYKLDDSGYRNRFYNCYY